MTYLKITTVLALICLALGGCATKSENVSAAYISPIVYKKYSCGQLRKEAARISQQVAKLTGVQDKKAENDAVVTGVAVVLFWPAAFFVGGDDHTTAQLAEMKGKFNALRAESERKRCNIRFEALQSPAEKKKKHKPVFKED